MIKANLNYLKRMSKPLVKYDLIRSIIEKKANKSAVAKAAGAGGKKSKKQAEEQTESVFTEKDFQDFQRSYFGVNN